ncbi:DNA polymerase III subunit gamma and tau [Arthrobacter crusticola]|uniref:DNA polymerase III subunit gamma/tau n=1 Tax=Arthrobacter crusticola TaxID=2547960 RepID=A0A4R5TUR4_9MICC|nr:DNA polymerase III subunit gamma and tau [Arthrobacter crusticola]TDK24792.1 DNA polymerase III subunit gamma and tau [Arthrobacter crusticola]
MSTALYRRYRPETFADVIGQEHVTDPLMAAIEKGRVNHAYLFSGPRGCGKTTSARILARCLNCAQGPTPTPCGVCDSCVELARNGSGSLDVIEIDAASHGGVDDARDLRERATFAPVRDRYKIFIIDEAHMVTSAGFNALLKIVEEPPEHILFIFATTEPDKVIGTIRSRTHHYPFRLVPQEPLMAYLELLCRQENVPVAPGVLSLVVRAGGGSVRDSLSVLDQLMAGAGESGVDYELAVSLLGYTHATLLDDVVDAVAAGDAATVFTAVDRVIQTGHDPRRFVEDLLERFRDLIVINAVPEGAASVLRGIPEDQLHRMRTQANQLGAGELSRAADITNTALTEMTGATSPRLHLELLCARILLPAADESVRGTLARVDRIERRLAYAGTDPAPATAAQPVRAAGQGSGRPAVPAADGMQGAAPVPAGSPSVPTGGTTRPTAGAPHASETATPGTPASGRTTAGESPSASRNADTAAAATPTPDATSPAATGGAAAPGGPAPEPRRGQDDDAASVTTPPGAVPAAPAPAPAPASADWGNSWGSEPHAQAAPAAAASAAAAPSADRANAGSTLADRSAGDPAAHSPAPTVEPGTGTSPGAPERPAQGAPAEAPAAPGGSGQIEMVRRAWPEIMDELAKIKRITWLNVNVDAKPRSMEGNKLILAFTTPGNAIAFQRGPHMDNVRQAIQKVLGLDCMIEAILDGPGRGESDPKVPASRPTPAKGAPDPQPNPGSNPGVGSPSAAAPLPHRSGAPVASPTGPAAAPNRPEAQPPAQSRAQGAPMGNAPGPAALSPAPAVPSPPEGSPRTQQPPERMSSVGNSAGPASGAAGPGPRRSDSAAPGSRTPGPPAPGPRMPDSPTQGSPKQGPPAPESPAPGSAAPDSRMPDSPAHGSRMPDSRMPGSRMPDSPTPGSPAPSSPAHGSPRTGDMTSRETGPSVGTPAVPTGDRVGSTGSRTVPSPSQGGSGLGPGAAPGAGPRGNQASGPSAPQPARDDSRPSSSSPEPPPSWQNPDPDDDSWALIEPPEDAYDPGPGHYGAPDAPASPSPSPSQESAAARRAPAGPQAQVVPQVHAQVQVPPQAQGHQGPPSATTATSFAGSDHGLPQAPSQASARPHAPAQPQTPAQPQSPAAAAGASQNAPTPATETSSKPISRYQRLLDEAARKRAEEAAAESGTVDLRYVEDVPSADDETIEETGLVGRSAIERILNGRLVEERRIDAQ